MSDHFEWYTIEHAGNVKVYLMNLKSMVNADAVSSFGQAILLASNSGRELFRLDCSGVDLLSSAARGKLIVVDKKIKKAGGQFVLYNLEPQLLKLLSETGLNRILKIDNDAGGSESVASSNPPKPAGSGSVRRKNQI